MEKIKSEYRIFGRRKGRKKLLDIFDQCVINSMAKNSVKLYSNDHNILDIGSGNGENAIFLSKMFPKSRIVACDIFSDGNVNLYKSILSNHIKNITLYEGNVMQFIDTLDKKKVFNTIWILFPDPWPKKRHNKRRLIDSVFMDKIKNILKKNGGIHIVTDSKSYLRQILSIVYEFRNIFAWENQKKSEWEFDSTKIVETKYYRKAIKSNRKSIYIKLNKL